MKHQADHGQIGRRKTAKTIGLEYIAWQKRVRAQEKADAKRQAELRESAS